MTLTVAQLADAFHAHYAVRVQTGESEQATADWYRFQLVALVRAAGHHPAAALRTFHLAGVGIEFTNGFVRALKALYRWATDEDVALVPANPFRKLATPPCGERTRVLTRPEVVRLYRACSREYRLFLFVLLHTIARPGEIRRLRWRDVRLPDRVIILTEFKGKRRRKDGVKIRTIPLDALVVRLLTTWYGRRHPGPDDHVFVSPRTGKAWEANALRCRMRRARERAGLEPEGEGERVVCYTLRHTGATNATKAGIRDRLLADIMGHSRTQTTARYQHLDSSDLVAGIDRLRASKGKR